MDTEQTGAEFAPVGTCDAASAWRPERAEEEWLAEWLGTRTVEPWMATRFLDVGSEIERRLGCPPSSWSTELWMCFDAAADRLMMPGSVGAFCDERVRERLSEVGGMELRRAGYMWADHILGVSDRDIAAKWGIGRTQVRRILGLDVRRSAIYGSGGGR